MATAVEWLYGVGRDQSGFLSAWALAQARWWDMQNGHQTWHLLSHGRLSDVSPIDFWNSNDPALPWFANLDIESYAPELLSIASPLNSRLDDFLREGWTYFQNHFKDPLVDPWINLSWPGSDKPDNGLVVAAIVKTGVMCLVAEYPLAPPERQTEIEGTLIEGANALQASSFFQLPALISHVGVPTYTGNGIVPLLAGFSDQQLTLAQKILNWIAANYSILFADRQVTITPTNGLGVNGRTDAWSGDIAIDVSVFDRPDAELTLVRTMSHELWHAKPNRLGRIYSAIRTNGLSFPKTFNSSIIDEAEEDFIQQAGSAMKAAYANDTSAAAYQVMFQSGIPAIANQTGAIVARLPDWSPVLDAFIQDYFASKFSSPGH